MTIFKKIIVDDFPALHQTNRGRPLVYLDSGASSQKPKAVIEAMSDFYSRDYANIHRGIYELGERATHLYESARKCVAAFIGAESTQQIAFVKSATEATNLLATTFAESYLKKDDEIIISGMEHHANLVPWLLLKERMGVVIKVIPVRDNGELDMDALPTLITSKTKLITVTHVSNVLGTVNPIKAITTIAHQKNIPVIVDGAQAVPHIKVDVTALDCDFYVFSSHKMYGPTGIGVLYAKSDWFDRLPPYQGGGDMIETVSFERVTFAKGYQKFEAGTPPIAEAIGLAAAIRYLDQIGMDQVAQHEQVLLQYLNTQLATFASIKIIGTSHSKIGVISFVHDDIHPHDLATILDHEGVAARAGHHCAMPLMERFNVPATIRVSLGIYNTENDIDRLIAALKNAEKVFL